MSKIVLNNTDEDIKYFHIDPKTKSVRFLDESGLRDVYHVNNLNQEVINHCINGRPLKFFTIFNNVFFLPKNFSVSVSFSNDSEFYEMNVTANFEKDIKNLDIEYSDFFQEILVELIQEKSTYNIAVSFSAGLDSSSILFSLVEIRKAIPNIKIVAFCWYGKFLSSNEDLILSKNICEELEVDFYPFEINHMDLLEPISDFQYSPIIDPSIGFMKVEKIIQEKLNRVFNTESFLIINGHGGDHIFLDPLPFSILLKNKKNFFKSFQKFQNYYSASYFNIFKNVITELFHEANLNNLSFNQQRMNAIYQACIDNSWKKDTQDSITTLYPFTQRKNINFCLNFDLESILDSEYSRNIYRKSMYKKFLHPVFLRNSKGHVTGIYQLCAKDKKNEIINLLKNGYLVEKRMVDIEELERDIERSSLGYGGFPSKLLLSICFEILIKKLLKE